MFAITKCAFILFLLYRHSRAFVKDPDEDRDVPQLIKSRGFIPETHFVTTKDGYILQIHRIRIPDADERKLKPVIMQHGLFGSSSDFLINSPGGDFNVSESQPGNNLAFEVAKEGRYDVWLSNSRGNIYGRNHTVLSPEEKKFWEFTYDEMIEFDMPAIIDYVLAQTNKSTVGYVGHSQGTVIMFGLLATQPKYNDIIKPYIAMAPVTTVGNVKSPIRFLAKNPILLEYFKYKGGCFLPPAKYVKYIADRVCPGAFGSLCEDLMFLFSGFDGKEMNKTRTPVYVSHTPAGTSAWDIVHWAQSVNSRRFSKFDYGSKMNRIKYNSDKPPEYKLKKITNKYIALFSAQNDWLADPDDVQALRDALCVDLIEDYVVPFKEWNHLDFIWGMHAGVYVNLPVIEVLDKYA